MKPKTTYKRVWAVVLGSGLFSVVCIEIGRPTGITSLGIFEHKTDANRWSQYLNEDKRARLNTKVVAFDMLALPLKANKKK